MRAFLGDGRALPRPHRPAASVGLARPRSLRLLEGLGLDFYQVHSYERPTASVARPPGRAVSIRAAPCWASFRPAAPPPTAAAIVAAPRATRGRGPGPCSRTTAPPIGRRAGALRGFTGLESDPPLPVYRLDERLVFPPPDHAEEGLLAVGGDLKPERLILAYSQGIFPWYQRGPILWHSPDPRMVLLADRLRVPRSLAKTDDAGALPPDPGHGIRARRLRLRFGAATGQTHLDHGRDEDAYGELHRRGFAHSVESWREGELVGGLYGVSLGRRSSGSRCSRTLPMPRRSRSWPS